MPKLHARLHRPVGDASSQSGGVLVFLQARMGSTRLPGKVLMAIHGQSILERAIRRLRASSVVDAVAVLTTHRQEDDAIVEECTRLGAWVYRGPDADVLARFYEAAQVFRPDIVIRATADNPLIDIGSLARIVAALRAGGLDLCMEKDLPYGAATEAMTAEALARVHARASEAHHREHVTLYMKEHPEEFALGFPLSPAEIRYPQIRVTVDTPEDFAFVEELVGRVSEAAGPLPLQQYLPAALGALAERECKALALSGR